MKLGWHVAFVICLGKSRWWRTVTLEHLIRPALMENLSAFTWVDTDLESGILLMTTLRPYKNLYEFRHNLKHPFLDD